MALGVCSSRLLVIRRIGVGSHKTHGIGNGQDIAHCIIGIGSDSAHRVGHSQHLSGGIVGIGGHTG